jgi:predicted dehydrogenase
VSARRPTTIGVVGAGWRADFYARIAHALPEHFALVGIAARRVEAADLMGERYGVSAYPSPEALLAAQRPDVVVCSVKDDANAEVISRLVARGAHVLAETPPAPDLDGLRRLWADIGSSGRVQIAEQYSLLPSHAARLAVVRSGVIGDISSVQVSSTHGCHAVSLMRAYLGIEGFEPTTVSSSAYALDLINTSTRAGWTGDAVPRPATNILSTIDFGGRLGVYDFTDNQWHNRLRFRRVLVRGSAGELSDEDVVHYVDEQTVLTSTIQRTQLGYDLNLDGYDTELLSFEGKVVHRNPYLGARLMDEEVAIASLMDAAGAWATDGGPEPYPLARACQDQLVALAIQESLDRREPVTTSVEDWAP